MMTLFLSARAAQSGFALPRSVGRKSWELGETGDSSSAGDGAALVSGTF